MRSRNLAGIALFCPFFRERVKIVKPDWLYWLLVTIFLSACSPGDMSRSFSVINETNVLSVMRQAESFQGAHLNETEGRGFARTLAALKAAGLSSRQLDAVVVAQSQSKSVYGYFFRDIANDERGSPLNNSVRYGLLAAPEKPGAGPSFLLLIDLSKLPINEEGATTGIGGERYKSSTASLAESRWPSTHELAAWEKIRQRTPQEAADAAKSVH